MNFDNLPERVYSKFSQVPPNEEIFLKKVEVLVELGKERISGQGQMLFTWAPSPRLTLTTDIKTNSAIAVLASNMTSEISVAGITADWFLYPTIPLHAEAFQTKDSQLKELVEVQFHLINFNEYSGTWTRNKQEGISTSRLLLTNGEWIITLDTADFVKDKIKEARKKSSYALTHIGILSKVDDLPFSSEEAEQFLKSFSRFMAFVQGRWVTPAIILGYNKNREQVWANWGIYGNTSAWKDLSSWYLPLEASEILPPVFEGYCNLIEQPNWREVFSKAVYWYVLANSISMSNFEGALIIAQTSLETLARQILLVDENVKKEKFDEENAAWRIRKILESCEIKNKNVPSILTKLTKYTHTLKKNKDGPGSLTTVRNALVHSGVGVPESWVIYEASVLALWYIELILLNKCKYSGRYLPRIYSRTPKASMTEPVPWAINNP